MESWMHGRDYWIYLNRFRDELSVLEKQGLESILVIENMASKKRFSLNYSKVTNSSQCLTLSEDRERVTMTINCWGLSYLKTRGYFETKYDSGKIIIYNQQRD